MEIGILTYHCVPNFGAQLQATSTVGYLRRMGHNPIVLNWYPQDLERMYSKRIPAAQIVAHDFYTKEFLPITEICRNEEQLVKVIEEHNLDGIIVGSDALFKYIPLKNRKYFSKRKLHYIKRNILSVELIDGNPFFGGFATKLSKRIPVVAYSVSSQNCAYQKMNLEEIKQMNSMMSNFAAITVRDEWTKGMVEYVTSNTDVPVTPDPVFSFNQNCYFKLPTKEIIVNKYHLAEKYILISFSTWYSSEHYIHSIATEVEKRGYQAVAFPMPEGLNAAGIENQIPIPLSPIDWYALIKYSSGYIGERMHPIVVCLHNTVPFFCFDEYGTSNKSLWGLRNTFQIESSKTYHILNKAGLKTCMFSYKTKKSFPLPEYILNEVLNFHKDTCRLFSIEQQSLYESSMLQEINCIKKAIK